LYMIDHPTAGYDVFFDKTGKGDQTKYIGFAIGRRETTIETKHLDFIEATPKKEEGVATTAQPTNGAATYTPPVAAPQPVQTIIPAATPSVPSAVMTAPPPPPKAFV